METISFDENNNSAPKAPMNDGSKRKKKLIAAGVVLAVLILSVIGWQYWQYTQTPYYKQMQVVKELEKMAKESDKWGGKTPEETVALFADAVKKGDFGLASKFGNIDNNIKSEIEKMKADGQMDLLIRELETGKIEEISGFGGNSVNLMANIDGLNVRVLSMHKSEGGTWKIDEF
ncbi:tetratricopeptide repeat protein [Patescibacteria group bacterium]|nr:tetratricopeptide repeat protein [Patescibacteria group bacterium]